MALVVLLACTTNTLIVLLSEPLRALVLRSTFSEDEEYRGPRESWVLFSRRMESTLIGDRYRLETYYVSCPGPESLPFGHEEFARLRPPAGFLSAKSTVPTETLGYQTAGWPVRCVYGAKWYYEHAIDPPFRSVGLRPVKITIPNGKAPAIRQWDIPFLPIWSGLAADLSFHGLLWSIPFVCIPALRRHLRGRGGGCPNCGYDLGATPSDQPCPECGAFKSVSPAMSGR